MKDKRPNVALIAEKCKCSSMTVSRALRNDSRVARATRTKILRVAEKLGYSPRVKRGRPRAGQKKTRLLADVIFSVHIGSESLYYAELLVSIERELRGHGCDCVIRTQGPDYDQFISLCETLRSSSAVGTLIVGYFPIKQMRTILEIRPEAILVDNTGDPRLSCPYECVGFDNAEAARMGVRHLAKTGRRRIALLKGTAAHYFSRDIERGYIDVLRERGLPRDKALILESDFTAGGAYKTICDARDEGLSMDGVFTSDEMAIGVLRALHDKGARVPDDVAVMGCDGLPIGRYTLPTLSTVILDYNRLGKLAVERIFTPRDDRNGPCRIGLVPHLEIRESSCSEIQEGRTGKAEKSVG